MLNNVKSNFSFNEINKKDFPAIYSTVFRCVLVVLLFFWLYCITTVTPFIKPKKALAFEDLSILFSYKVSYFQRSPVTRHRLV